MKNTKEQTAQLNRDAVAIASIHETMLAELADAPLTKDAALDKAIVMLTAIANGKNFDAFVYLQAVNEIQAARLQPVAEFALDTVTLSPDAFAKLRTLAGNTPDDTQDAESLLADAQAAQIAYWDAVKDLEAALGFDIEADDLSAQTIESLTEEFGTI